MSNAPAFFGKYQVVSRLGAGGMAEVYKCRLAGIGGFDKTVVVKTLLPQHLGDRSFVEMFLDEARIAANLTHPNIVQIFEVDQFDDVPYLAMEFVNGPTLATLQSAARARRRLHFDYGVKVISGMCDGLHHAHTARTPMGEPMQIVHRDVSPQNLMVSSDGVPKLLDFGVAKAKGRLSQSEVGVLKGKLRYLAPELLEGAPVDPRTDVYAAAACLYEVVTGEALHSGITEPEILAAISKHVTRRPTEVFPGCPEKLEQIIMWGLDPNPDKRCTTALALHEALEDFIAASSHQSSTRDVADWVADLFPTGNFTAQQTGSADLRPLPPLLSAQVAVTAQSPILLETPKPLTTVPEEALWQKSSPDIATAPPLMRSPGSSPTAPTPAPSRIVAAFADTAPALNVSPSPGIKPAPALRAVAAPRDAEPPVMPAPSHAAPPRAAEPPARLPVKPRAPDLVDDAPSAPLARTAPLGAFYGALACCALLGLAVVTQAMSPRGAAAKATPHPEQALVLIDAAQKQADGKHWAPARELLVDAQPQLDNQTDAALTVRWVSLHAQVDREDSLARVRGLAAIGEQARARELLCSLVDKDIEITALREVASQLAPAGAGAPPCPAIDVVAHR